MNYKIKTIPVQLYSRAIDIFGEAFADYDLYTFAFPDKKERRKITKLMYEFVVMHMIPGMGLKLKGAFVDGELAGAIVYTTPDSSNEWTDKLANAVTEMRSRANNERMNLIGEYAMKSSEYRPEFSHFYLNEIAVLPEMQGKGIATAMINDVEQECIKHPTAVGTGLDTSNERNVLLYKKLGYKMESEFYFYELKVYSMFKRLAVTKTNN